MKKILFSLAAVLISMSTVFAQDIITKKTGEDIPAQISEVTQTEIKYKRFDNLDGPIFSILKSEVLLIRYQNGTKDIFNDITPSASSTNVAEKLSDEEMALKGKDDAKVNYRGANSGAGWVAATTILFSPIIGVIPAAACASAPPADRNLNYRDQELMKNNAYSNAYIEQAYKTKKSNIWTSFGIGSGAWALLMLLF